MSEMRVYQEKMLNSKKEIVVCNWERGEGKTYSIFRKIMENKNGKYLYISPFEPRALQDYFREYVYEENILIKLHKCSRDKISIEFNNGDILEVFCYKPNNEPRALRNISITFFDEYYPSKEYIDSIVKPKDVIQIFIMMSNNTIEYIDSRTNKITRSNFCDIQIEELMIEYAETPKNKNTTLSRENILKQINVLQNMRCGNKE